MHVARLIELVNPPHTSSEAVRQKLHSAAVQSLHSYRQECALLICIGSVCLYVQAVVGHGSAHIFAAHGITSSPTLSGGSSFTVTVKQHYTRLQY